MGSLLLNCGPRTKGLCYGAAEVGAGLNVWAAELGLLLVTSNYILRMFLVLPIRAAITFPAPLGGLLVVRC